MATITKTEVEALAHQLVTHPGSVVGSALSVSGDLAAWVFVYHAYIETTANADPAEIHIQATPYDAGDEGWTTIVRFDTSTTAPVNEALTATEPGGETSLACASTTGFVAGDTIYIVDTTTLAASEWAKIENVVTNTSVDVVYGLTTGKDSADVMHTEAEVFHALIDLTAMKRLRVYYINRAAAGSNTHIKAVMVQADSIG